MQPMYAVTHRSSVVAKSSDYYEALNQMARFLAEHPSVGDYEVSIAVY